MKLIPLTKGLFTKVDDEDYDFLMQWKWYCLKDRDTHYARSSEYISGKTKSIIMHRLIMNTPKDMIVDHIDHDGLNNQKSNLRICTIHENNMNKRPPKNKSHRGVYFRDDDRVRNWLAYITFNKKHIYIGAFNTESEAIEARIKKEIELFGNFSPQNNKRK